MNPYVKHSNKVKIQTDMTTKEKLSSLTSNLIHLLAENDHLNSIPGVISAFSSMMSVTTMEKCLVQLPLLL